ncbi:hypothetical protein TNCV_919381 [Trichonephila clavipes]|nr:hypothetical protein TNCV_919381 [Trichonephila clavipes]
MSNFLGHTIIFSGPSRHFDSSQIPILTLIVTYQVAQVPFINKIMLVYSNNVFKDFYMACQVTRSFANACLRRAGKATAAVPRYRRINCADAKTMAGSSTGGHK